MTTPHINPNDPKWTAYVLGELDEADVQAVDHLLAVSPEARALIEELRASATALEAALASEPSVGLTLAQRAAVRAEANAHSPSRLASPVMHWGWAAGVAAAAALVIAVALSHAPQPAPQAPATAGTVVEAPALVPTPAASPSTDGSRPSDLPGARDRSDASRRVEPPAAQPLVAPPPAPPLAARAEAATPVVTVDAAPQPDAANAGTRADARTAARTTLSGTVRDGSGAGLPGVTVTVLKPANEIVATTLTDGMGRYSFANLDNGVAYRVTATLAGFVSASADLRADTGSRLQKDITMAVGALAEAIVVTGQTPTVQTQSARRGADTLGQLVVPANGAGRGGGQGIGVASVAPSALVNTFAPTGIPRSTANTESYARVGENGFVRVSQEPLATFSIDVDTASYSNVRRFLTQNQLPPADAVRVEELINYFTYDYPRPAGPHPIGASMAVAAAPWNPRNRLVRIGVKAREIEAARRPPSNLVFLIDVSGSMNTPQKLPLLKSGLKLLVDQLGENDAVSIVVYAGASGLVLPPTRGDRKDTIARALDDLQPGGSTNGAAGIRLAYNEATTGFIRGGTNRVILMTDGDFNVGVTSQGDLTRLIEERARSGVFLSVLGFGMGNLKDSTLETLADKGNGNYAYIDSLNEARKVLVEQMSGTLVTVAKDVKIQVDFNPAKVEAYRLIGYENRALRPEDFNNDLKDAGDMGAGHTVTALFEVVPRGGTVPGPSIDPSVFQPPVTRTPPPASTSNDMLVLRVRYKLPDAAESTRMDVPLADRGAAFPAADADFRFAASVAAFGMILKDSPYRGETTLNWVLDTATASRGQDRGGYRDEFISLVQKAIALERRR